MDPNVGLQAASGLVSFLLKTTLEWLVCLAVVRLTTSARWRFNLWLALLVAFVAQWLWMWTDVARSALAVRTIVPAVVPERVSSRAIAVAPRFAPDVTKILLALLGIYIAVLLWRGVGAIAARMRLARAMRFRRPAPEPLARIFSEIVGDAQANGRDLTDCELCVLPGISSPATVGVLRPSVAVPPASESHEEPELRAAFWHELKHVQRHDALWNMLVGACRALLWFHPAVRHASHALHAQRELACDEAVIGEHPHSRAVYASCLVRFARTSAAPAEPAIQMASHPSLLATRVRTILNDAPPMSGLAQASRAAANLLLIGATAATVPAINVLFAMQIRLPLMQIPVMNVTANDVQVHPKSPSRRRIETRAGSAVLENAAAPRSNIAASVPHDDSLAAEHRAAMGILTESSGMDAPASSDQRVSPDARSGAPARAAAPTSWGSVAIDAAERIALIPDHDGDRH